MMLLLLRRVMRQLPQRARPRLQLPRRRRTKHSARPVQQRLPRIQQQLMRMLPGTEPYAFSLLGEAPAGSCAQVERQIFAALQPPNPTLASEYLAQVWG